MTANQKLELSREIRQWIGIAVSVTGIAYWIDPNGTKKTISNVINKFKKPDKKLEP